MTNKKKRQLAMLIAMYVRNEMEDFHCENLNDTQMKELNIIIRNAIYTVLYAADSDSAASKALLNFQNNLIPRYWEQPQLTEDYQALRRYIRKHGVPALYSIKLRGQS